MIPGYFLTLSLSYMMWSGTSPLRHCFLYLLTNTIFTLFQTHDMILILIRGDCKGLQSWRRPE